MQSKENNITQPTGDIDANPGSKNKTKPKARTKPDKTGFNELMLASSTFETSGPSVELHITSDQDAAELVVRIVKFMKFIKDYRENLYLIKTNLKGKNYCYTHPFGKTFISLCRQSMLSIVEAFPLHEINPWVQVFFNQIRKLRHTDPHFRPELPWPVDLQDHVESMNRAVAQLREAMSNHSFIKSEKKWKKRTSHAKSRFLKIVKLAFQQHAKLIVVRIDFGLKRHQYLNPKEPISLRHTRTNAEDHHALLSNQNGTQALPYADTRLEATDSQKKAVLQTLGFEQIDKAREKVLRRIRDVFRRSLVGYIWKLEYGARKGFHYHCVFLLKGSMHRQDINVGNMIGKLWANYAPHELGIFWNCNADRRRYKFPGVGMLHYHESGHWKGLTHIADYLSKPGYYISLKLPPARRRRTFGTSVTSTRTTKKPGPRRTKHCNFDHHE